MLCTTELPHAVSEELHRIAAEGAAERMELLAQHDALQRRIDDLQHELAHVAFDRDCLATELTRQKEIANYRNPVLGPAPDDLRDRAVKRQLEHVARCLLDVDSYLLERLKKVKTPVENKLQAVTVVHYETGWGLRESKQWVEENYFRES